MKMTFEVSYDTYRVLVARQKSMSDKLGRYVGMNEVLEYVATLRADSEAAGDKIREAKKRLGMCKAKQVVGGIT